jgi:hypothetical protein
MPPTSRHSSASRARVRDLGLRRVSVVTRGLVAVSVAGVGAFSALAAWSYPGRSKTTNTSSSLRQRSVGFVSPTTSPLTSPSVTPTLPASNGTDNLAPPPSAPDPGYQYVPTPVVTGAT